MPHPLFQISILRMKRRGATEELQALPIVPFDPKVHFAKQPRKPEFPNLLKVKGRSPNIIELLGGTEDGRLVFPRCLVFPDYFAYSESLVAIKKWCIQLADAVCTLHSLDIIHRDLELRNILRSLDYENLLCDLESDRSRN
ncbi:hypothetical protein H0H92_011306 [Tricholoma furcatifolium]|nr:hypothetical protein H0H92_011306 [Tricholoma furcatifolium]